MNRDLYQALEVLPNANEEEIKRAYRRLALLYHPDRNQSGAGAEERFKEANDAYSILGDREKRRRYDLYREFLIHSARWGIPSSPAQEKILAELFLDPKFPSLGRWVDEVLRARGFSANGTPFSNFLRTTLQQFLHIYGEGTRRERSGGKGARFRVTSVPRALFRRVGSALNPVDAGQRRGGGNRARSGKANPSHSARPSAERGSDIEWTLPLTLEEAEKGTRLTLSFLRDDHWDRLSVRVPPGTREGVRLRIRNKGRRIASSGESGDLYLRVLIR